MTHSRRRLFPYYSQRQWLTIRAPYRDYTVGDLEELKRAIGSGETGVPVTLPWVLELAHRVWEARAGNRQYRDYVIYGSLLQQFKTHDPTAGDWQQWYKMRWTIEEICL